jgi:MoaA/NifB/PqqE/SkfB family radical SAM enzyme
MRSSPSNTFEPDDLIRFIQIFDVPLHIYFSGGEPLANPDIMPLIKCVKDNSSNIKIGIFTCGVLSNITEIDKYYAKKLKEYGLDDCYISLYHCEPEKHDLITKQNGSYYATIQSIHNLLDCNIDVKIHLVINSYNYQELDRIIFDTLKFGVSQVRLLRIVKTGAAERNWDTIGVPYEKQNTAIRKIINNIGEYNGTITVSGFPDEIACRPSPNAIKCQAGTHLLYITHSKEVYPCACTKNNPLFLICSFNDITKLKKYIYKQRECLCNEKCLNPIII